VRAEFRGQRSFTSPRIHVRMPDLLHYRTFGRRTFGTVYPCTNTVESWLKNLKMKIYWAMIVWRILAQGLKKRQVSTRPIPLNSYHSSVYPERKATAVAIRSKIRPLLRATNLRVNQKMQFKGNQLTL